jgi:diguanylate cyclase (GGDEF)-like protein
MGGSIGIAIYPNHTDNLEQLVEIADETMYKVKRDGKNGFLLAS